MNIKEYINNFKTELDIYDKKLTEKAEKVSKDIKEIQEELKKLKVEPFSMGWDELVDDQYSLNLGLRWDGSKVLFCFETEVEVILGAKRQIRVICEKHLEDFLKAGINSIKKKTEELN